MGLGLLMWASQVTPEQASSNIAAWPMFFGMKELPWWAGNSAIDQWVFWGGFVGVIGWAIFIWMRSRKQTTATQAIKPITRTSEEAEVSTNKQVPQVPIVMEFNPEDGKYFNQEDRPSDVSVVTERYREYYCMMFNDSDETLRNVSCEVEKLITAQNRPTDRQIDPETIHEKLRFELPQYPTRNDFSPRAREKLWLFSRLKKALDNEPIRMVKGSRSFHDKGRQRKVFLRVTAENYAPKTFSVTVWVHEGLLRMTWIQPED